MKKVDYSRNVAELVNGIPTAKNQNGIDATGKPKKSDNKNWRFGDSLRDVKPGKIA